MIEEFKNYHFEIIEYTGTKYYYYKIYKTLKESKLFDTAEEARFAAIGQILQLESECVDVP